MLHKYFENISKKPKIFLMADPDSLGLTLINHFLSNFCEVFVLTSKEESWKEKTAILRSNNLFNIVNIDEEIKDFDLCYLIFVDLYLNRTKKEINKAIFLSQAITGKKFIIYPYQVDNQEDRKKLIETKFLFNQKVIDSEYFYLGDVLGPNLNSLSYIYKIISYLKSGIMIRNESLIYPILAKDIAIELSTNLFSFGPPSSEVSYIGQGIYCKDFINLVESFGNSETSSYVSFPARIKVGNSVEKIYKTSLNYSVKETIDWFDKNVPLNPVKIRKYKKEKSPLKKFKLPKIKLDFVFSKRLKNTKNIAIFPKVNLSRIKVFYLSFFLFFALTVPFVSILVSTVSFLSSLKLLEKGNATGSLLLMRVSRYSTVFSERTFRMYSFVPVIGIPYKNSYFVVSLLKDANNILEKTHSIYGIVQDLPSKVLGNDLYSLSTISHDIYLELDSLEKEMGFIIGEIESLSSRQKETLYKYIQRERLDSIKNGVTFSKNIANNLNDILGVKERRTYIILFQNNMELRPTGGFIGSFALISFESGRLIEINVQDVYSADGQLKGHVEPPVPIKDYLGEGGWYLRDANWDPDFFATANKIEWFLEKEIDQKVDGVIALDLEFVKNLLKETGPISLSDYNQIIDYKNIYEITQSEVEDNFFPGSRKKANYLTALSKELIDKLVNNELGSYTKILRVIINGLEEKHIQLSFHNTKLQKTISEYSYDGKVIPKYCLTNCFYDFVSYVDANVGVNKANYFIERSSFLNILLSEDKVTNILRITIKNNGNPLLGDKVRYKSYLRALGLPGSVFEDVIINQYNQEDVVIPEVENLNNYKSAGVLVTVGAGEEKTIQFNWTNKITNKINFLASGEFGIYFRKQAGTVNDKLSLSVYHPNSMGNISSSFFSLTQQGSYVYNTLLMRDIFPLIYW